jgi:predicted metalloprotease with PDZ domain
MTQSSQSPEKPRPEIRIEVGMPEPWTHYFDVRMTVSGLEQEYARLRMPVWTPGSYMVREFSRNVHGFSASCESGNSLEWEKTDKCTWQVSTDPAKSWSVGYRVYAFEMSVRTCFLDDSHGYINGAGLFMLLEGFENSAYRLHIKPYSEWSEISTGLDPVPGEPNEFIAPDFDTLVDCPIEIGNQEILAFEIEGKPHRISIYGGGEFSRERLAADFSRIIEACASMMGGLPYRNFSFLLHFLSDGRGGLEHANSMSIQTSRWFALSEDSYLRFLDLIAHEFFHVWNVKRVRPAGLGPFDYSRENYTRLLWVSEGFTDYYSGRILRRAGLIEPSAYLAELSKSVRELQDTPGRSVQSVSEASFDAWIKFYRPQPNSANTTVSYYLKGSLIGLVLDLELRKRGVGEGLDDIMRRLYREFWQERNRGFTEAEFRDICEQAAGGALNEIFEEYACGTGEIDFEHYLEYAGLRFSPPETGADTSGRGQLGISVKSVEGKVLIDAVTAGGAGWKHGLNVQDEIIAVNGFRASTEFLSGYLQTKPAGFELQVLAARDGRIRAFDVRLGERTGREYKIERIGYPSEEQKRLYESWIYAAWE